MAKTDQGDNGLEAFFEAARQHSPAPDSAFTARLVEQALAVQPEASGLPAPGQRTQRRWLAAFGGWPALTGLATATIAGLWIGAAQPAVVGDMAFGGLQSEYDFSGLVAGHDFGFEDG